MESIRTVQAVFPSNSSRRYAYFVLDGDEPKKGDLILTSCNFDAMDNIDFSQSSLRELSSSNIAQIAEVDIIPSPKATKCYLQLLSLESIAAVQRSNKELFEKRRQQMQAQSKLEEMLKEQNDLSRFEALAQSNPEAAKLLEILKG